VEPNQHCDREDWCVSVRLDLAMFGRVLGQRQMRARPVIVIEVLGERSGMAG